MARNDSAAPSRRQGRPRIIPMLVAGLALLLIAGGVSTWLILHFITAPQKTIVLPEAAVNADSTDAQATKFAGKVVDAATHQPVAAFTAQIGVDQDDKAVNYMNDAAQTCANGSYSVTSEFNAQFYAGWHVRIVARGYKTAESPTLYAGQSHDFELTPAADLQGRVLDAQGRPVEGVTVALVLERTRANINNGILTDRGEFKSVTGADGRFDLPPPTDHFAIVAMSDAGYAQVNQDTLAKNGDVPLAAWGNIHGEAFIGTKPAAATKLIVSNAMQPRTLNDAWIINQISAVTAQDGSFDINRVPPGSVRVGRFVNQTGQFSSFYTDWATAQAPAGGSATVKLGGVGQPVTGKLLLPPGLEWSRLISFGISVEPQSRSSSAHFYSGQIAPDHQLLIDNVVSGDYQMTINMQPSRGQSPPPTTMPFTMPEVAGGVSDEPLDVGEIQVKGN